MLLTLLYVATYYAPIVFGPPGGPVIQLLTLNSMTGD